MHSPPYHTLVEELADWISSSSSRTADFQMAIQTAGSQGIHELAAIRSLADYLRFLSDTITWLPSENMDGTAIYHRFGLVFFIFSQSSVAHYQSPIDPSRHHDAPLSFFSEWIIRFGRSVGAWMDDPASLSCATLESFRNSPPFCLDEYIEPRYGWSCFNEFFARHFKPGKRPIDFVSDNYRVIAPTDFLFISQHPIRDDATVEVKTLQWRISELLAKSEYTQRFSGGVWLQGFLGTYDYHRFHAPVGGRVVEARTVLGTCYCQAIVKDIDSEQTVPADNSTSESQVPGKTIEKKRLFDCPKDIGYQFFQARGLIVLETDIGMVAVIPVGMAVVSSVVLTAEVGTDLRKGEELGYFQFGGSDIIVLLEPRTQLDVSATIGTHYKMGQEIGRVS